KPPPCGAEVRSDIPHIFQAFDLTCWSWHLPRTDRSEVVAGASAGQFPPPLLMWRYVQATIAATLGDSGAKTPVGSFSGPDLPAAFCAPVYPCHHHARPAP